MWPIGQVRQAKWVPKWVISHYFLHFLCKCINDVPMNVLSLKCIIVSYVIIANYDVTSSCDVMMSPMMSSHVHVWQVI